MSRLTIFIAQLNPVVGDIKGNLALARSTLEEGKAAGADLIVFSEMFILAYPAEDLVLKPSAVELSMTAIRDLAKETATGPGSTDRFALGGKWQVVQLCGSPLRRRNRWAL